MCRVVGDDIASLPPMSTRRICAGCRSRRLGCGRSIVAHLADALPGGRQGLAVCSGDRLKAASISCRDPRSQVARLDREWVMNDSESVARALSGSLDQAGLGWNAEFCYRRLWNDERVWRGCTIASSRESDPTSEDEKWGGGSAEVKSRWFNVKRQFSYGEFAKPGSFESLEAVNELSCDGGAAGWIRHGGDLGSDRVGKVA